MEKVLFVVRSLKEKLVINLESLLLHGNEDFREQILKREEKRRISQNKAHMARKGNPISVRLDLNRSSDSSRFSEGDRESHRMGSVRLFLIFVCPPRRERTLQMSGTDTTSSNARRPQEETRDQSMS